MVYMLWYGGGSYAFPQAEDADRLPSIAAAVRLFEDRLHNRVMPATPCVDERAEAWLFLNRDPVDSDGDLYPDQRIVIGPRGGIRVDRYC